MKSAHFSVVKYDNESKHNNQILYVQNKIYTVCAED